MIEELVYKCKVKSLNYIRSNNITIGTNTLIEGLKINNKDTELLNMLGLCLYKKCKFNDAIAVFKKSIYLDGNDKAKEYLNVIESEEFKEVLTLYDKGLELLKSMELDKSLEIFENIVEGNSSLIEPYIIVTEIYMYKRDYIKAIKWLELLMKADSGNNKISRYKEFIRKEMGEELEDTAFIEAELNHKEITEVRFLLAMSYEEMGNYDMAIEEYKKYVDESVKKSYEECALYNLIRLTGKLGRMEEKDIYEEKLNNSYGKVKVKFIS